MGKLGRTLDLMSASWQILLLDREILALPVLSGICSTSVMVSFMLLAMKGEWLPAMVGKGGTQDQAIVGYVLLFLFYVVNYFIIYFFNSAIVACAAIRLQGGDPTLNDGLSVAIERIGTIAAWAFVAGTVGFILGSMESRSRSGRNLVAGLLGIAWSVLTFLAVPLMVVEKCPAGAIIPRSKELVKGTWGEQVMGNVGFGTLFAILSAPAFLLFFYLGMHRGDSFPLAALIAAVVYLVLLSIVQSALRTIFSTVLYLFAAKGKAPDGFADQQLREAMQAT